MAVSGSTGNYHCPAVSQTAEQLQSGATYVKYIGAGAIATGGIISLIKSLPLIISTFRDSMKSMKGGSVKGTQQETARIFR